MIQGLELSPGAWVLQNDETERNTGVILDPGVPTAPDSSALLSIAAIDPGDSTIELDALSRFTADMGGQLALLIFTSNPGSHPALERFPEAVSIAPQTTGDLPLPFSGWELLSLSPGRLAVYNRKARLLFCGDMLGASPVPDLSTGADAYLQALEQFEMPNTVLVVPGRGPIAKGKKAIRERIAANRDYTQNLVRHVLTSIASRLPRERVVNVAREVYSDYPFVDAHVRNLEAVWDELSPS
jgi:hypothetical protein